MKKNIVLFVLFVLPIVAYLFFASGVNEFSSLPVLRPKIAEFGDWKSQRAESVKLTDKITILNFGGTELLHNRGNYFNLNQKVYQRYHKFNDLQFVIVCPVGTEEDAKALLASLKAITDISDYHFIFAPPAEIAAFYNSLQLEGKLSPTMGSEYVYLVDKERNLRGRKDSKEYKEGYSTFHPSELSNEMLDDFKVLLYEYRAALKKNLPKRQI